MAYIIDVIIPVTKATLSVSSAGEHPIHLFWVNIISYKVTHLKKKSATDKLKNNRHTGCNHTHTYSWLCFWETVLQS